MFLSIITINRNNAEGLKKTLESVASQTCRDFEHIIIDGASTDGSVDVIKEYVASPAGKNVSYWVSEPDSGVYNAMNKGIKKATGDYCLFLNSGDWLFDNNVINREAELKHTESIIYYDAIFLKEGKEEKIDYPEQLSAYYFACGSTLNHQNELIKTSLQQENLYNENLKIFADNEFNIKNIVKTDISFKHSKNTLSYYDASDGISSRNIDLFKEEQNQVLLKYYGKELIDICKLLNDYETGYFGILKILRKILNKISMFTFRRKENC